MGAYLLGPLPKTEKEKKPRTAYVLAKAATRTAPVRDEDVPRTAPVRVKAVLSDLPRTAHVHNEYIPIPTANNKVRVRI